VDFSYVNLGGTFYYLCSVLDGASRAILAWDIRPQMREADAEIVIQGAREAYPVARPRLISDNGPQFVAKDFKEFIRLWQSSHILCSPYYPQSNGKLERYHRTLKEQAIRGLYRPLQPRPASFGHWYIAPMNRLAGRHLAIFSARDKKLETAREARRMKSQQLTARVA
jgi:putative transposase